MEYFEKREYSDGLKYVRAQTLIPGVTYFVRCIDENNQVFFSPAQTPSLQTNPLPTPSFSTTEAYYSNQTSQNDDVHVALNPTNNNPPDLRPISPHEIEEARSLHLGICISSIFIPTVIYMIGWPFCNMRLKSLAERNAGNEAVVGSMKTYTALGWWTWFLHLCTLITFCTFWIPTCTERTEYNGGYYYGSPVGTYYYQICQVTNGGIVAVSMIPIMTVIFTIITTILGAIFINGTPTSYNTQEFSTLSTFVHQ